MRRRGQRVSSHPDYSLTQEQDWRRFQNVVLQRLPNHDSKHWAVVTTFYSGTKQKIQLYLKGHQQFPLKFPQYAPQIEIESMFEEFRSSCGELPVRKRPANTWILQDTWKLVNQRDILCRGGCFSQHGNRAMGRQICASPKQDKQQRAANIAKQIEHHLSAGDPTEAWRTPKGWYRTVDNHAPKPFFLSMNVHTREKVKLYE